MPAASSPSGRLGPDSGTKKRKQRPIFSCADCRRLKSKCDREVPCSHCIRRGFSQNCVNDRHSRTTEPTHGQDERGQGAASHVRQSHPSVMDATVPSDDRGPPVGAPLHNVQDAYPPSASRTRAEPQAPSPHTTGFTQTQSASPRVVPSPSGRPAEQTITRSFFPVNHASDLQAQDRQPASAQGRGSQTSSCSTSRAVGSTFSYGTLVLGSNGTSKYLGPTAASEWLKDSETQEIQETAPNSRAPSPDNAAGSSSLQQSQRPLSPIAFPFNSTSANVRTADLIARSPPKDEASTLVDCYYRYCSWHHDVIPRSRFDQIFNNLYGSAQARRSDAQNIASVYIVSAQGTSFNSEMPNVDPSAEEWLHLSERASVKGNFLAVNTIAGVQTSHSMAHYHSHVDKGNRGDSAWTSWGSCMRMIQAMGMHRDGARWNLPPDVSDERRKVFWECNAADIFQAQCFARPFTINQNHCDTSYPASSGATEEARSYTSLRFDLSKISAEVLDNASNVRTPDYSVVMGLHDRICQFENALPFNLRCRAAFSATPSRYSDIATAELMTPEPSRRSMASSFQQSSSASNICETIIWLHRPYYAKALYADGNGRQLSEFAPSYLAVIERCAVGRRHGANPIDYQTIISIVADIHARFPAVTTRQWHLWYHAFNSAVCSGTSILRDPGNVLADFAVSQITIATNLYAMLIQSSGPVPRAVRNFQWLVKSQSRVSAKMASARPKPGEVTPGLGSEDRGSNDGEDVELLGWRTRLVERASHTRARTIDPTVGSLVQDAPSGPDTAEFISTLSQTCGASSPTVRDTSADISQCDFWDPMASQALSQTPSYSQDLQTETDAFFFHFTDMDSQPC